MKIYWNGAELIGLGIWAILIVTFGLVILGAYVWDKIEDYKRKRQK